MIEDSSGINEAASSIAGQSEECITQDSDLYSVALGLLRLRKDMAKHFAKGIFRDEAWDVFLNLYIAAAEGRDIVVKEALLLVERPSTSAARLLARLERADLIEREPGALDRRQTIIRLTTRGLFAVTSALRTFSNYRAESYEMPHRRRRRRRSRGTYPRPAEITGCS
jgi:DNA-binding MarR family transcriptional regulator